jgi:similar to stage IV sporulation protein
VISRRGIPVIFERYKHRYGIIVGMLAALALVFLSCNFIWEIRVTGNESIPSAEIKEMLRGYGFSVGAYIPSVNTDRIENRVLMETDTVSWISVNITGTVAEVQIRERSAPELDDGDTSPANLGASKAGIIEEVRIYSGNVVVKAGQYVEKGALLVSGLYDSDRVGFRYTTASGAVLARTVSEYTVEIPYEYEKKCYSGEEIYDKYLNFFDYSINILKNSRKEGVFYDKIDIVENYSLLGAYLPPLERRTVKYMAYETVTMTRSVEEAEVLAYGKLSALLGEDADDRILIRKTVTPKIGDRSFSLHCVVVAIEDIARSSPFTVEEAVQNQ